MPLRFSIGVGSLGEEKINFVDRSKRDFETKTWENFSDFETNRRIERQNYKIETRVRKADRVCRILEFNQGFINDRKVVAPRESKRF